AGFDINATPSNAAGGDAVTPTVSKRTPPQPYTVSDADRDFGVAERWRPVLVYFGLRFKHDAYRVPPLPPDVLLMISRSGGTDKYIVTGHQASQSDVQHRAANGYR